MNRELARRLRFFGVTLFTLIILLVTIALMAPVGGIVQGNAAMVAPLPTTEGNLVLDFSPSAYGNNWVPLSGQWQIRDNDNDNQFKYRQEDSNAINATAFYTDTVAGDYRFQVDVFRTDGNGSYGIAFNINFETSQPTYLARFSDIVGEIQWGHLSPEGDFLRQDGFRPTNGWDPTETQTLAVDVIGDSYTVLLINKTSDAGLRVYF